MKIWEKNLYKDLIKTNLFFLLCFFILYVFVDFSTFSVRFIKNGWPPFLHLFLYYVYHFSRYLDLFLPLSFMLSIIRILHEKNTYNEITPLLCASLSKKKLCTPFLYVGIFISCICFLNYEFMVPISMDGIRGFKKDHSKSTKLKKKKFGIAPLEDGSSLVYYEKKSKLLYDVFWVKSSDDILHMKVLKIEDPPIGFYVDHLKRKDLLFEKIESFEKVNIPAIKNLKIADTSVFIPYENRKISTLFQQIRQKTYASNEEKANILTNLHLKIATSFFPLLIFLALPPYLFKFSRVKKIYILCACSLFSFFAFFTLIDSVAILSENQVFSPFISIWTPFLLLFFFFSIPFYRMR